MPKNLALAIVTLTLALVAISCDDGAPANAQAFCENTEAVFCDRAFECVAAADRDAAFTQSFGSSAAECKELSGAAMSCVDAAARCPRYNAGAAQTCLDKVSALSCAEFADLASGLPAECAAACQ